MPKTLREIEESPVDPKDKIDFWKAEEINAKSDIEDGMSELKKALQRKTTSLGDVGKNAAEIRKANRKINFNRSKLFQAKRKRFIAESSAKQRKQKKYWK